MITQDIFATPPHYFCKKCMRKRTENLCFVIGNKKKSVFEELSLARTTLYSVKHYIRKVPVSSSHLNGHT